MNTVEEFVSTDMGESAPIADGKSAPIAPSSLGGSSTTKLCLRCFAYQVGKNLYRAECIDLDIGTEAESLEEAITGLGEAIDGYLMVVLENVRTNEEMPGAALRPSPLSHRLHYYFGLFMSKVLSFALLDEKSSKRKFYRTPYGLFSAQCNV